MKPQPRSRAERDADDLTIALLSDWFARHGRVLPWRAASADAWAVLISEIMLQQTPVVRVLPVYEVWLERWPRPADMAAEDPGEVVRAWGRLGYPRRALRLHAAATAITEQHGGVVPDDVGALLALPGIGEYTARAVATFGYGQRHPVVDTNVRRVVARVFRGDGDPGPVRTRAELVEVEALLPEGIAEATIASAAVMEFGALVCTARSPRCDDCPIRERCAWARAGFPEFDGPTQAVQAKFEGSDRQVRGLIMALLRDAHSGVEASAVRSVWPLDEQRDRALAGLLSDGLVHLDAGLYRL